MRVQSRTRAHRAGADPARTRSLGMKQRGPQMWPDKIQVCRQGCALSEHQQKTRQRQDGKVSRIRYRTDPKSKDCLTWKEFLDWSRTHHLVEWIKTTPVTWWERINYLKELQFSGFYTAMDSRVLIISIA